MFTVELLLWSGKGQAGDLCTVRKIVKRTRKFGRKKADVIQFSFH